MAISLKQGMIHKERCARNIEGGGPALLSISLTLGICVALSSFGQRVQDWGLKAAILIEFWNAGS